MNKLVFPTLSELPPDARAGVRAMMDQLVIVLVKRNGGTLEIPISEIDDTGGDVLTMEPNQAEGVFIFEVRKKQ